MERFVKGDVVVVDFPYSNLAGSKRRPTLVAAKSTDDDIVLCQITSQQKFDEHAINLEETDFTSGRLPVNSFIRPNKLFTAHLSIVEYKIGEIRLTKTNEVENALVKLFKPQTN